jgi:transposase-like protein
VKRADPGKVLRAARLSRVPGVTISEACARFDVTSSAVAKARKTVRDLPLEELAVAALTTNGTVETGALTPEILESIANWIDAINRDGCQPAEVLVHLDRAKPWIAIENGAWRLLEPWP